MPSGLLEDLIAQVQDCYGPSKSTEVTRMENLKRGSTYTPAENAIRLQQCSSESNKVWAIVKQRSEVGGDENERETRLLRSWDPCIYNNQRNCLLGYGMPVKAIGPYSARNSNAPLMLYTLCSIISACNPLWMSIDQKEQPFAHDNWHRHVLAHLQTNYMKHSSASCPPNSPFNGGRSTAKLREILEKSMPTELSGSDVTFHDDPEKFYKFSCQYMKCLFPLTDFPKLSINSLGAEME